MSQHVAGFLTPYAYEDITVDNTVGGKGFTQSKLKPSATAQDRDYGKARYIYVSVEGADIRYTVDGTAPVAGGPGHILEQGGTITFENYQASLLFRAIRETSVSATLRVTYFH